MNAAGDNQAKDDGNNMETADPVEPKKQQPKAKPVKKQEPPTQQKQDSPKPSHPILKQKDEKPKEEKPAKTAAEVKSELQKGDASRGRTVSINTDFLSWNSNYVRSDWCRRNFKYQ